MKHWDITWDIEANNLLNNDTIDYTTVPYKLRDSFQIHCIVAEVVVGEKEYTYGFHSGEKYVFDGQKHTETVDGVVYELEAGYEAVDYIHKPLEEFPAFVKAIPENSVVRGHNIINYDLLATKLYWGIPYTVEQDVSKTSVLGDDYWDNKKVVFDDTLVRSKTINPDRYGGHSLEVLAKKGDTQKFEFRKHIPQADRFKHFAADMLYYNIFDVKSNRSVAKMLDEEMQEYGWGDKWNSAIKLEKAVAELVTRQEHRGFKFDVGLAQSNLDELDKLMEERRTKIEAILPNRPATKALEKDFTPPKIQFKRDGGLSANLLKFADKIGAEITEDNKFLWKGKELDLPLPLKPLVTEMESTINDTTHIKDWLVGLGWRPGEYKEKDLTVDSKKNKLSVEKLHASIERYVEQSVETSFCRDRCEHLGITVGPRMTKESVAAKLRAELVKRSERGYGVKVLTNPSFTVGQEKEICPDLERLASSSEELRCITDITEYLTYRHRRNSILGGGASYEDFDTDVDEQTAKGYLASVREDGRIPTPADTCGAATSRFKHRLVTNIPRVTSLYGENMRAMFGVDDTCFQIGYDFDSLEARQEANFCWEHEEDEGKEYCSALLQEKPNDVHCYSEDTEVLTAEGWKLFGDLREADTVAQWDEGVISYVKPLGIVWQDYSGPMVRIQNKVMDQFVTPNHRVVTTDPRSGLNKIRRAEEFLKLTSQMAVPTCGKYVGGGKDSSFVRLLVAVQADGCFAKGCSAIQFSFVKERKYFRLLELLEEVGAEYTIGKHFRKGRDELRVRLLAEGVSKEIREVLGDNKELPFSLIVQGYAEVIVEESKFWDGTQPREATSVLDTTCKSTRDFLQACAVVSGFNAYCQTFEDKAGNYGACTIHRCLINEKTFSKTFKASQDVTEVYYEGKIGCVAVPSGLIIVRRNGKACVSGNTMMSKKIASTIQKEFGRGPAKSVKYGITYGAQGAKVAKTVGCDKKTGEAIFDAFWEAAAPLKRLKDTLAVEWNRFGKKKIVGIDGRLVPTRSAHAILNSKFQSAGVICAKRAMVLHDRKLRDSGLLVDFFGDDWRERDFCQQLIAYHDEAQLEVNKSSVQFKRFLTKEEAEAFKVREYESSGKVWSDISESPKGGVYVAYCQAGQMAIESVNESGRDYGMVVDLTAGYMVERTWAGCH